MVFVGDVVLLASWDHDLQLALELSVEKRIIHVKDHGSQTEKGGEPTLNLG